MRHLLMLVALVGVANAETVHYSASGTFDAGVPVSFFTSPGAFWQMDFNLDDDQPPIHSFADSFFAPIFDFQYLLDSVPLSLDPTISFFTLDAGGMFLVDLSDNNFFLFSGDQVFDGTTTDPIMRIGDFVTDSGAVEVGGSNVQSLHDVVVNSVEVAGVPEPATFTCGAAGLLLLAARLRRTRS